MNKDTLHKFIQLYRLKGMNESVAWRVQNGLTTVGFRTDANDLFGYVTSSDITFPDASYAVYSSAKLYNMISVLDDDISSSVVYDSTNTRIIALSLTDGKITVTYPLADIAVIPPVPPIKTLPDFELSINITPKLASKIDRSFSAEYAADFDTNVTVTLALKDNRAYIVVGKTKNNTSKITLEVAEYDNDQLPDEIYKKLNGMQFSGKHVTEVLAANKESDATFDFSSRGLLGISYKTKSYTASYYLGKK